MMPRQLSRVINARKASTAIRQRGTEEVALKNRHRCRMHETSRARNITHGARLGVAVSPRDVSRNMRALEQPTRAGDEHSPFPGFFKPVLRASVMRARIGRSEKSGITLTRYTEKIF